MLDVASIYLSSTMPLSYMKAMPVSMTLTSCMNTKFVTAGVRFHKGLVDSLEHEDTFSSLRCKDGTVLEGRMVLDATGHARKLIEFGEKFDPGYQACPKPTYDGDLLHQSVLL